MNYEDLILIGGSPRSGTTLVQNILDSHPAIYGGPEFGQLPSIISLRRSMRTAAGSGAITNYVSYETIDQHLRELTLQWLSPPAMQKGASRISEKTPGNALCMEELLELFPKAAGIHVVRNPAAVFASMLTVKKRYESSGREMPERLASDQAMAATISAHMLAGIRAVQAYPDRCFMVRYESLVADPESTVRDMCLKSGIRFHDAMLQPANHKHDAETLVRSGTPWYTVDEFYRNPDPTRATAWHRDVSEEQIRILEEAFASNSDELEKLGYHPFRSPEQGERAVSNVTGPQND